MTVQGKDTAGEGIRTLGLSGKEFIQLARASFADDLEQEPPLMFHGPPGVGKTDTARELAIQLFRDWTAKNGGRADAEITSETKTGGDSEPETMLLKNAHGQFHCIIISAPLLEPTDIKGIPAIDYEKKLAYWLEPYFLPRSGPGLILIDDMTAASRSVVSSLLMLIQHRRVLKYRLPKDVMVIAAGNRIEDMSYCDNLSAAMRSRMLHVDFKVELDEWVEWANRNELHTSTVAFLRWKQGGKYLYTTGKALAERSYPCPRTWAYVSRILNKNLPKNITREAVMGLVGNGIGNEFMMYMDVYEKLPTIDEILNNPEKAKVPEAMDALYSIATTVARAVKKTENIPAVITYTMRLPDEFQVKVVDDAIKINFAIVTAGQKMTNGKTNYGGYINEFVKRHKKVLMQHGAWCEGKR